MSAPEKIKELVAAFERLAAGPAPESFDEAQLRVSFVNPFWEALGWNVRDPAEVVIEKRVATRASTKHADYCFQLGGKPQFVVEAKDYFRHRSLDDRDIIFQAKRYGYNLPADFAVLTNFAELRVYDAGLEPIYENPARGFLKKLRFGYQDYIPRWDELAVAFSRDAVAAGALRSLLPKARRARNKEALDRKFFERLNEWRAELARVIALRNGELSSYDINEAVQRILDRCIFIRVVEDRGIEATELLRDALSRWRDEKEKPLYQYVVDKFRYLEPQYNGELFYRHFSEDLLVDDRPLRAFLESLYYPRCPYQFNVVGVELLGTVYERFLGSTIRLTPSHRAVVEEKPEVRKAGGVYYTPKYIVDYIVANTVGELLKKCKTPADVARLKILDPACGSGSFLLGAFQRLIDWHEDYFNARGTARRPDINVRPTKARAHSRAPLQGPCFYDKDAGRLRLTAKFKGQILLNNIFGVDIDPQACEVTRMSLYLKVLEGVQAQYLMKTALLPPLDANVKCGNSLIGSDYFDAHVGQTLMSVRGKGRRTRMSGLQDEEERRRVNPFDWDVEFEEIMARGGFDAVIGNPPYVRQEGLGEQKEYFKSHYETYVSTADLYVNFIEKALKLTKKGGRFGYIVSNKWMRARYGEKLRAFVKKYDVEKLVDFGELKVFQDAATFPLIIIINKRKSDSKPLYAPIKTLEFEDLAKEVEEVGFELEEGALADAGFSLIRKDALAVIEKMKAAGVPLGEYVGGKIYRGILTGFNKAFVIDRPTRDRLIKEDPRAVDIIKPFVVGDDVRKYHINFRERYLIITKIGVPIKEYPAVFDYLKQYQKQLEKRWDKGNHWWELRACDYYEEFEKPKIVWPEIAKESRFGWDNEKYYFNKTCFIMPTDDFYLLGILNSKITWYFLLRLCPVLGDPDKKGRLTQQAVYVEQIPIKLIDNNSRRADVARHDTMVALVEEMLALHKRHAAAKSDADKNIIQRAIKATDKKIDALVYELYGLTDEEIKIVEGS